MFLCQKFLPTPRNSSCVQKKFSLKETKLSKGSLRRYQLRNDWKHLFSAFLHMINFSVFKLFFFCPKLLWRFSLQKDAGRISMQIKTFLFRTSYVDLKYSYLVQHASAWLWRKKKYGVRIPCWRGFRFFFDKKGQATFWAKKKEQKTATKVTFLTFVIFFETFSIFEASKMY